MIALDTKSNHILDAALPVFVRHGFRKASMADIARAANISRASLYLSFGSKEELFRAGSTRAHASTMRNAVELFEVNMALAKDITLAARATLVERLAQALADAQAAGVVALDRLNAKPADIANVIVAAMEGIKHAPGDGEKLEAGMQLFMRLLRAAIS